METCSLCDSGCLLFAVQLSGLVHLCFPETQSALIELADVIYIYCADHPFVPLYSGVSFPAQPLEPVWPPVKPTPTPQSLPPPSLTSQPLSF